jgi:hypothetical protein
VTAALRRLRDDYGPSWQPKGYQADLLRGEAKAATAKPDAKAKSDAKAKPQETAKTAGKADTAKDGKSAAPAGPAGVGGAATGQDLFVWFGAKSGKLGLIDLCRGDDAGIVYVIFTPSSVPGRKAS